MTLTEFLLARIAEDEVWVTEHYAGATIGILPPDAERIVPIPGSIDRVLTECEAKRRIVELHAAYPEPQVMVYGTIVACSECGSVDDSPIPWPCSTLRAIALPYADHPDYDEEWRP